jgi:hypothetical protein
MAEHHPVLRSVIEIFVIEPMGARTNFVGRG